MDLCVTLFIWAMSSLCMCRRCCGVELINRTVLVGIELSLFCPLNNSMDDVTWYTVSSSGNNIVISTCDGNTMSCTDIDSAARDLATYTISRNETTSTLTTGVSENTQSTHYCKMDDVIVRSYYFILINSEDILSPTCSISPSLLSGGFDVSRINHSCQSHLSQEISQRLDIHSVNETLVTGDSILLNYIVDSDDKHIQLPVSCEMLVTDVNEARNCIFPKKVKIHFQANSIDMEFECNSSEREEHNQIFWRLLEPDGEVNTSNRSWIRQKGRLMLLKDITEQDDGRVVECVVRHHSKSRIITSIGFHKIELDNVYFPSVPSDQGGTSENNGGINQTSFKMLFFIIFTVWLLTLASFISIKIYCMQRMTKSSGMLEIPVNLYSVGSESIPSNTVKESASRVRFHGNHRVIDEDGYEIPMVMNKTSSSRECSIELSHTRNKENSIASLNAGGSDRHNKYKAIDEDGYEIPILSKLPGSSDTSQISTVRSKPGSIMTANRKNYVNIPNNTLDDNGYEIPMKTTKRKPSGKEELEHRYEDMSLYHHEYEYMKNVTYENCLK